MSEIFPSQLTCEYLINPCCIDVLRPRLGWRLDATDSAAGTRGVRQTAYQLLVARDAAQLAEDRGDLWDSGRVSSSETIGVVYGGVPLRAWLDCFWKVRVWDDGERASDWSPVAHWSIGPLSWSDWGLPIEGCGGGPLWIGESVPADWSDKIAYPVTHVRSGFHVQGKVKRATLIVTAKGLYEARLNGQRVGDQQLAPEWTDYDKRIQYQAFDVTHLIREGENAIGALLADGWCCGQIGMMSVDPQKRNRGYYAKRPSLLAYLRVDQVDGKVAGVVTNHTWRYSTDGPIRKSDLLSGEVIDARRGKHGWDAVGFDDKSWKPVQVDDQRGRQLVAQINEPIRITSKINPIAMTQPRPGVFIFDMGQNMVGWCRLRARGPAGTTIRLRHGEMLREDGSLYRDNLRLSPDTELGKALQEDTFILAGSADEVFEPRFTYHGFRYVELTGCAQPPSVEDIVGCVLHSSPKDTLEFECSDPAVNKLVEAIRWTLRGNLHSTPTDCPQRNERLGWMGDAQVFSQTGNFLMSLPSFWAKWLRDVRDAQTSDGRFPDFAPHPFDSNLHFSGNPGWADAGVIVPWCSYVNFGDKRVLEQNYEAAKRWIEFIATRNPDGLWTRDRNWRLEYGDWLNGDTFIGLENWPKTGSEVPKVIYATAFFAYSTQLLARMAMVLGKEEDQKHYGELATKIGAAFTAAFVKEDGTMEGDTQAGYALALAFDILPESLRPLAAAKMRAGVERVGGRLSTGIQSTIRIMNELTRWGHADAAYRVMLSREIPGWLYMIDNGATTVWERWDGYVKDRKPSPFQNPGMNSFNHYAIGAVGEWIVRTVGGINPDASHPGYKHFELRPVPDPTGKITYARAAYESVRGRIECRWHVNHHETVYEVRVPINTQATIYLPDALINRVSESGKPVTSVPSLRVANDSDGRCVVVAESGAYLFRVSK